uniref:Kinesin motor domain-containing protein n=1 Tax=Macrostomum lignano TaxID=282301 RepID=A0A1I8F4J1_9PLAT
SARRPPNPQRFQGRSGGQANAQRATGAPVYGGPVEGGAAVAALPAFAGAAAAEVLQNDVYRAAVNEGDYQSGRNYDGAGHHGNGSSMSVDSRRRQVTVPESQLLQSGHRSSRGPRLFTFDSVFTDADSATDLCGGRAARPSADRAEWLRRMRAGARPPGTRSPGRPTVSISAVELRGGSSDATLRDLLTGRALGDARPSELPAESAELAGRILDAALARRDVAGSPSGESVGDSHLVVTLWLHQRGGGHGGVGGGGGGSRLQLLDLRPGRRSLAGLAAALLALAGGQRRPQRQSQVFRLLADCLAGGRGRACLVAPVSTRPAWLPESLLLLQFAARLRRLRLHRAAAAAARSANVEGDDNEGDKDDCGALQSRRFQSEDADETSSERSCDTVIFLGPRPPAAQPRLPPQELWIDGPKAGPSLAPPQESPQESPPRQQRPHPTKRDAVTQSDEADLLEVKQEGSKPNARRRASNLMLLSRWRPSLRDRNSIGDVGAAVSSAAQVAVEAAAGGSGGSSGYESTLRDSGLECRQIAAEAKAGLATGTAIPRASRCRSAPPTQPLSSSRDSEAERCIRREKAAELLRQQEQLLVELRRAKQLLMAREGSWRVELPVSRSMHPESRGYLKSLARETAVLQRRVAACKSRLMLVTCFDARPTASRSSATNKDHRSVSQPSKPSTATTDPCPQPSNDYRSVSTAV